MPINRQSFMQKAAQALENSTKKVAEQAKRNASWSKKISGAISSTPAVINGEIIKSSVIVDKKKAPEAGAFEFGSGLHRTEGSPSKYVIAPKAGLFNGVLAFEWPGRNPNFPSGGKFIRALPNGKFLFWYVDHPGVEARPYLYPAHESLINNIKKDLAQQFKSFVLEVNKK